MSTSWASGHAAFLYVAGSMAFIPTGMGTISKGWMYCIIHVSQSEYVDYVANLELGHMMHGE
ncbi:hypothetical protein ANAPH2_00813 [Anaplasma phagocytophilum]|nr:hypothetical protein ANAPH2_00813 [Anaplasma phagocytophilum]